MDDHINELLQTAFEESILSGDNSGGLLASGPLDPQHRHQHQDAFYPGDDLTNYYHHVAAQTVHPANPTCYESYGYSYSYEPHGLGQQFQHSFPPLQYHSCPGSSSTRSQYGPGPLSTQYQPSSSSNHSQGRALRAIALKSPQWPILPDHEPPKPASEHADKAVIFCLNSDPQTPMLGIVDQLENDTWLHLRNGTGCIAQESPVPKPPPCPG
ncbi:hypothetical protein, variant [Phialophora macrospora]|uniref:Uncharacterized protein n=1 Tax=Phialophora macrospora TaxID=1851006 RepID=A0A0D2DX50_9EURO|nr:hypothetical protein, variant [Phialophora macrospora]